MKVTVLHYPDRRIDTLKSSNLKSEILCTMAVFLFKPRFAPLVISGAKRTTIRPSRKRPLTPGQYLSLRKWTGRPYGSKQEVLREAVLTEVAEVEFCLAMDTHEVRLLSINGHLIRCEKELDQWVQDEGFENAHDMGEWFGAEHKLTPGGEFFKGNLYRWTLV